MECVCEYAHITLPALGREFICKKLRELTGQIQNASFLHSVCSMLLDLFHSMYFTVTDYSLQYIKLSKSL
jgi:hypothetical protein